jgi:hypothetical protein
VCRYACLILLITITVCGCGRRDAEPETQTAEAVEAEEALPVRVQVEEPQAPPTPPPVVEVKHPIVAVVREFLQVVAKGDFRQAVALGTPGTFTTQGLIGFNQTFQLDQADIAQAWLGTENSAVITSMIPTRQGSQATWGFALILTENGRWQIRDAAFLPDQGTIDGYLTAFRGIEPNAEAVKP